VSTPKLPGASGVPTPWWVRIMVVVGALPAVFAIVIFAFVMRTGCAHDESRCPFQDVETRDLDAHASVLEQSRRCIEDVEEHRWLVVRDHGAPLELGRMPQERIGERFPWEARIEDDRVIIDVTNEPRGVFTLREPFADGGTGAPMPE
jgi:hypothetical protein